MKPRYRKDNLAKNCLQSTLNYSLKPKNYKINKQ